MIRLNILIITCFALPFGAKAQQLDSIQFSRFAIDVLYADFEGFNEQITDLGFPELPPEVANFSFALLQKEGRVLRSFSLNLGITSDEDDPSPSTTFNFVGVSTLSAINLFNEQSPWFLGPGIGVTLRYERMVLSENENPGNIRAASQTNFIKLNRFHVPIHGGLFFNRFMLLNKQKNNYLILGLNGQYAIDTNSERWSVSGAVPVENNGINTAGWRFGFSIGFHFG